MDGKFILNFAPTGLIHSKEITPEVPIAPTEIIEQVLEMIDLGINMVHLHACEPQIGMPTFRKEIYADIISGIRRKNRELIICVSTSGRLFSDFEERSDVLDLKGELKPDFASLTLSSLNFHKEASINSPQMVRELAAKMMRNNIRPELEAFDLGMINYAKYLIRKRLLRPPYYFNLVLGNIAGAQPNLLTFGLMVNELPERSIWSAGGIGGFQLQVNAMAMVAGGGIRVGLEDNVWYDPERTTLASNRDLVERILSIARALKREPYTRREARRVLGV